MKAKARLTALVLALALGLALCSAPAAAVVSPNGSYCLDEAGVLRERTVDYITERNYNLESACKGAQICVVVLPTIEGGSITEYAAAVFEKWQIGREGEDNGILMLLLTEDSDYLILPGAGLGETLDAYTLTDVYRSCVEPYFNDGDYDTAVSEAFRKLNTAVCEFYGADPNGFAGGEGFTGGGSGRYGKNGIYGQGNSKGNGSSCRTFGTISLAACGACVGMELLSTLGGKK